jgi:hypothetical protein
VFGTTTHGHATHGINPIEDVSDGGDGRGRVSFGQESLALVPYRAALCPREAPRRKRFLTAGEPVGSPTDVVPVTMHT